MKKQLLILTEELKTLLGDENIYPYLYARNALHNFALHSLAADPGRKQALLPAYSCGDEYAAIVSAGYEVVPYKTTSTMQPDYPHLLQLINSKTGLVLFTNIFGIKHDIPADLMQVLQSKKITILNDCAHFLPLDESPWVGDARVFSLRKVLPVAHGAILQTRTGINWKEYLPDINAYNKDLYIYYAQRSGQIVKGTSITDIYSQMGWPDTDQHGPRLPYSGGYSLTLPAQSAAAIACELEQLQARAAKLKEVVSQLQKKLAGNTLFQLFAAQFLAENIMPAYLPFSVSNNAETASQAKAKGLEGLQTFWSFKHRFTDWNVFTAEAVMKEQICVFDTRWELSKESLKVLIEVINANSI